MRSLFGLLVMGFVMVVGGTYAWNRMRQVPLVAPAVVPKKTLENAPTYAEAQQAQQSVTMVGPLADYMAKEAPAAAPNAQQVETLTWVPTASDHVGGSVVGSTIPILHKTFRVRSTVQMAFEVPAHAASPRLRGTFQSSLKPGGGGGIDPEAAVEFLVLNEPQYSDFLNRRSGESTFAADDAPAGEVNASLPPTMNQPARYHLLFRNNSHGAEKKFVQADFRMEF